MSYKWLLPIGALILLCFLFLINDNSYDDSPDYEDEVSDLVVEENDEILHVSPAYKIVQEIESSGDQTSEDESIDDSYFPVEVPSGIEIPVGGRNHNLYISHAGYSLSYDTISHCPFWVAWELTSDESHGSYGRSNDFRPDPKLPYRHRVSESAFGASGYDRGHMCPAGDQKWSELAMSESFFMSNMCPQDPNLNQVWWEHLEEAERRWARQEGSVYIVCGPIFDNRESISWIEGYKINVGIPDGFFKVILSLKSGKEKSIGFIFRNNSSRQPIGNAACSVDHVEEITGYDFYSTLDDDLEARLESNFKLGTWN